MFKNTLIHLEEKIDLLFAEMERDLLWRQEEVSYLERSLNYSQKISDESKIIKMLIVMLYSHYEGGAKFLMTLFLEKINLENLKINGTTNYAIKAAGLDRIFSSYENISKKNLDFKKEEENFIHLFSRRKELIEKLSTFEEEPLILEDKIINTQSNLNYKTLCKNLYKIGIEYKEFAECEDCINKLVNLRNEIAHGAMKNIKITLQDYNVIKKNIYEVIKKIMQLIIKNYKFFLEDSSKKGLLTSKDKKIIKYKIKKSKKKKITFDIMSRHPDL